MNNTNDIGRSLQSTNWFSSILSLLASSSTLICCALPALLVTLGAGAALSSLVSVFPQIVWLSEHKFLVFGVALVLMELRELCLRTRKISLRIYAVSVVCLLIGGFFAFIAPLFL
jgi:hypothetical protein